MYLRSGRWQPVYLPSATGVHRHGSGVHVLTFRTRDIGQSVHRQADEPIKVLRVRFVRQRRLRAGRHTSHERLPNRYKET